MQISVIRNREAITGHIGDRESMRAFHASAKSLAGNIIGAQIRLRFDLWDVASIKNFFAVLLKGRHFIQHTISNPTWGSFRNPWASAHSSGATSDFRAAFGRDSGVIVLNRGIPRFFQLEFGSALSAPAFLAMLYRLENAALWAWKYTPVRKLTSHTPLSAQTWDAITKHRTSGFSDIPEANTGRPLPPPVTRDLVASLLAAMSPPATLEEISVESAADMLMLSSDLPYDTAEVITNYVRVWRAAATPAPASAVTHEGEEV